jgi:glycosyltransferase involved in cell wall biosynthesis
VPAVAFDVGGVRQWLQHGHNGFLVAADPPTAQRFAQALIEALSKATDPRMRNAARAVARSMSISAHLDALETVLRQAVPTPEQAGVTS